MEIVEVLKKYKTTKIIRLIKKGKINKEEALMSSIILNKDEIAFYILDNYDIDLDYTDISGSDFLEVATRYGNIEVIKKLGVDINRKYKCGKKELCVMIFIRDLNTFKYFEKHFDKKEIKKSLEYIIKSTLMNYNIELLDYIVKKYKVNIKKIKYEVNKKKYNLLEMSNEILSGMKNREYRKREMAYYISDLLGKRYKKVQKRAYHLLEEIEEENIKIEKYNKYIRKLFGD